MANEIHPIYRLWFLWVDPVLTVMGMYVNYLDHDTATKAFFVDYPPPVELKVFLYQIAGMGTSYLTLFILLLRYTNDINIWKILQLSILWADFTMLASIYIGMRLGNRLAVSDWRWEDWFSIVITGICTVLRALFLLGVGIHEVEPKGKTI